MAGAAAPSFERQLDGARRQLEADSRIKWYVTLHFEILLATFLDVTIQLLVFGQESCSLSIDHNLNFLGIVAVVIEERYYSYAFGVLLNDSFRSLMTFDLSYYRSSSTQLTNSDRYTIVKLYIVDEVQARSSIITPDNQKKCISKEKSISNIESGSSSVQTIDPKADKQFFSPTASIILETIAQKMKEETDNLKPAAKVMQWKQIRQPLSP
ncbi:acetyltransferase [Striga asiatica]|uniref:Acetyltransferase n=1 Tax=Striga asiatica TaxID=4170 RepID=A0A5A7R892_STRAF|nr:acetyltransferase [Striga asiatica]